MARTQIKNQMKIICIGRNYTEHARELNNPVPVEPVVFLKPETALVLKKMPFFLPEHSKDVHYEAELVYKIVQNGKFIEERFAHKYVSQVTLGIDFTARDVQQRCKEKGLPWEIAKAFDGAAIVGDFKDLNPSEINKPIRFALHKNGVEVQNGNSEDMIFSITAIISYVSRIFMLKKGDLIFTGTPAGVGPVKKDDVLEGYVNGEKVFAKKVV
jgi:2-keto-4-pentenoate hydratase/2-oxohepta-3-ene-1,7-dioic acid hydratase in catechol pathway